MAAISYSPGKHGHRRDELYHFPDPSGEQLGVCQAAREGDALHLPPGCGGKRGDGLGLLKRHGVVDYLCQMVAVSDPPFHLPAICRAAVGIQAALARISSRSSCWV